MVFINYVRSNNQLHFRMPVKIFDKQILIGLPGASGNKSHCIIFKQLNQWQILGFIPNLKYTVETGITHYSHLIDADFRQITLGTFILHKYMVEVTQHVSVRSAVPFKENLPTTEDGRHAINRCATLVQLIQIVFPKLILDEECHAGIHQIEELLHIAWLVERQVANNIRPPVILTHFVTRRRKECQQNTIIGIFGTYLLYQRTPLLKLAQRSRVEPDIARILLQLLPKKLIHHPMSLHHLPWFTAERSSQMYHNIIDYYCQIIKHTISVKNE